MRQRWYVECDTKTEKGEDNTVYNAEGEAYSIQDLVVGISYAISFH